MKPNKTFEDDAPKAKAGKSKSAKGAPKPRKLRGRTINRRRERFLRKMAKKLEKVGTMDLDPSSEARLKNDIREAMAKSREAQSNKVSKLKK
jgi:hypothetical protein